MENTGPCAPFKDLHKGRIWDHTVIQCSNPLPLGNMSNEYRHWERRAERRNVSEVTHTHKKPNKKQLTPSRSLLQRARCLHPTLLKPWQVQKETPAHQPFTVEAQQFCSPSGLMNMNVNNVCCNVLSLSTSCKHQGAPWGVLVSSHINTPEYEAKWKCRKPAWRDFPGLELSQHYYTFVF